MRFADPLFLFLILLLVPLWFFIIREFRIKKRVIDFFGWDTSRLKSRQMEKGFLISFMILFLVLAFARPQIESYENKAGPKTNTEIALCFDVSRSMGLAKKDKDSPSRIDRSKEIAQYILNSAQGAKVAVFGLTSICQELVPLSHDLDLASSTIEFLIYTESVGGTGSYLGQGLKEIIEKFPEDNCQKYIVFFSDGEFNDSPEDASFLEESIQKLKEKNIKLILVGVGETPGIKIPVFDQNGQIVDYHVSALDENNLRAIAAKANGVYLSENDKEGVVSCIKEGSADKDAGEDSLTRKKVYNDIYWIFLLPAVICWWIIVRKYN